MTLEAWLNKNFGILNHRGDEVQFPCPKCKQSDFWFNTKKKVGHCFRASCAFNPTMAELNAMCRTKISPTKTSVTSPSPEPPKKEIALPIAAKAIIQQVNGQLVSVYPEVVKHIEKRGVTPQNQYRFDLRYDGNRVYIPVYSEGKLVNYVGRAAWWKHLDITRYAYCPGASSREIIFNWDEMKHKPYITLVENTFNGIWLMDYVNGTSNFGSDLSKQQLELIKLSPKVKTVIILWDEKAEVRAAKAVNSLRKVGVRACYIEIKKQPDDYSLDTIKSWVVDALTESENGAMMIDRCGI